LQILSEQAPFHHKRERTGHTPAKKKHGRSMRCASFITAYGLIQEQLASELSLLHVSLSLCNDSIDLNQTNVNPDGVAVHNSHDFGDTSNNNVYNPTSISNPLPHIQAHLSLQQKK
jgi:hypothetical protein